MVEIWVSLKDGLKKGKYNLCNIYFTPKSRCSRFFLILPLLHISCHIKIVLVGLFKIYAVLEFLLKIFQINTVLVLF